MTDLDIETSYYSNIAIMRRSSRIKQEHSPQNPERPTPTRSHGTFTKEKVLKPKKRESSGKRSRPTSASSDVSHVDTTVEGSETDTPVPRAKKRRIAHSSKNAHRNSQLHNRLFGDAASAENATPGSCRLPGRVHRVTYHRPVLLDSREGRASLLRWFDATSTARAMPWRKPWFDPAADSTADDSLTARRQKQLERRAYEVWISEIMLQQTRVAVVIEYWNRWMAKWPTIQDLAAAGPDEVLAAWRGLGYYSRATRIHEAAKLVTSDAGMQGRLPASAEELQAKVPGVGRYTAGAISAIVFGRAAPMVDGNVLRVLSRQLGLLGDVKTDKTVIDLLWAAADALVKTVSRDFSDSVEEPSPRDEPPVSDRPGRWGQALMELGSTVCTPKPNCAACPISSTCRAYAEGLQLSVRKGLAPEDFAPASIDARVVEIEDSCELCKPLDEYEPDEAENGVAASEKKSQPRKQASLRSFAFTRTVKSQNSTQHTLSTSATEEIANHARKFPVKAIKKAVREEETLVCAIRRGDGSYLINKRPEKGLLAGLWEFPSYILPSTNDSTLKTRKQAAAQHVSTVLGISIPKAKNSHTSCIKHTGELGSVPWLFSHIKLTMHVHLFELDVAEDIMDSVASDPSRQSRWSNAVDDESMGTGMRKCWALVNKAAEASD